MRKRSFIAIVAVFSLALSCLSLGLVSPAIASSHRPSVKLVELTGSQIPAAAVKAGVNDTCSRYTTVFWGQALTTGDWQLNGPCQKLKVLNSFVPHQNTDTNAQGDLDFAQSNCHSGWTNVHYYLGQPNVGTDMLWQGYKCFSNQMNFVFYAMSGPKVCYTDTNGVVHCYFRGGDVTAGISAHQAWGRASHFMYEMMNPPKNSTSLPCGQTNGCAAVFFTNLPITNVLGIHNPDEWWVNMQGSNVHFALIRKGT